MRFITATLTIAAACASAAVAVASPARISDVQFIAANRCLGIESTKAFASPDADTLRQLVKEQNWGRDSYIYDKADQARDDGQRDASRSGAENNVRLTSERDGGVPRPGKHHHRVRPEPHAQHDAIGFPPRRCCG